MAKAKNDRRPVVINNIEGHRPGGDHVYFDIQINPLLDPEESLLGFSPTFQNTTRNRQLQEELQQANRQLETASEDRQSTNDELSERTEEIDNVNHFHGIHPHQPENWRDRGPRRHAPVGVEPPGRGPVGLRSGEAVKSHLPNLDIGLPVDRLKPLVRSVLTDGGDEVRSAETVLDAVNRKGRTIDSGDSPAGWAERETTASPASSWSSTRSTAGVPVQN